MYGEIEFEYVPADEYEDFVVKPLEDGIYEVLVNLYGDLYERGCAGYYSSQELNIVNVFRTAAEELCAEAIEKMENLGAILIRPE